MSAEFVVEMAWKSSVLAVAVLTLLVAMRRHDPAHRAAVGGLGLALLSLLPVIVLAVAVLPVPSIELPAPASTSPVVPVTMEQGAALFPLAGPEPHASTAPTVPVETLIGTLWAAGALLVLLRLAAGLLTLRRWTRAAEILSSPKWVDVMRRSGAPDAALLMVSDRVRAPLSWGWRVPVILINRDALAQPGEAEAIIAHEAAHLARRDWPRLLAARLAVALFWFNPLVWLLERRHLQDVEEAADEQAAAHIEPTLYAQTLLNVARDRSVPLGANSMARGTLSKRIKSVLSPRVKSPRERIWRSGALAGVAMIAAPVAITQFVSPAVSAAATPAVTPAAGPVLAAAAPAPAPTPVAEVSEPAAAAKVAAAVAIAQAASPEPLATPMIDREEIDRALRSAEEARAQAMAVARDADRIAADARAQVAASMANMRTDMLRGADEMERGAVEMRRGAAQMREEARKLRDPAYRAEQIRKAAARGDRVPTDQELIDAIPKMEEGARKMDSGVEEMRRGAQRMREQARRS